MATVMQPQQGLGLSEFVDRWADKEMGRDLVSLGRLSLALLYRIGDAPEARALLATNFWRAWIAMQGTASTLAGLGATDGVFSHGRFIIVSRRHLQRFDLLILDPGLEASRAPKMLDLLSGKLSTSELREGAQRAATEGVAPAIGTDAAALAVESFAKNTQPFSVVLAPAPETQRLALPNGATQVSDGSSGSTAGLVVRDTNRPADEGVTVALHAIQNAQTVGSNIRVGGQQGTLVRTESVTDSGFVKLSVLPKSGGRSLKGVMRAIAPRGNQAAQFEGVTSGTTSTTITGWDQQIPTPSRLRQACLYTGRDAQPGDSGAALVTDDDYVVGFAFERTLPGQNPVYCSWIWADSVMAALGIERI